MKFFNGALIFVFAAVLAGCSSAPKFGEGVYPVGAVLPLSGESAAAARDALDGMLLAAKKVNSAGGIAGLELKIVARDCGAGKSFGEAFDALRRDGVKVVSVGFDEQVVSWHTRLMKCDDVFINYMCQYPPATLDSQNSTRIFLNGAQDGDLLSTVVERPDSRDVNIVAMSVDSLFGKACGDYLTFCLKLEHTKFYSDVFSSGTRDFSIFSEQMKRLFPQYIFYVGRGSELKPFVESVCRGGYSGVIASCAVFGFEPFDVPEGVKFYRTATAFELGKVATPVSREFVAAFKAEFGREPTWVAAYGYDSVLALSKAVVAAKFNPAKMRAQFAGAKIDGAVGTITFDSSADSLSELEVVGK